MARRRVAEFVDGLHDRVQGRVVSDGRVGSAEVVVDRAGKPDDRDVVLLGEETGSGERTVASDDHQGIDACGDHVVMGLFAAFGGHELLASGRFENRAAQLDDVADALRLELHDFVEYKTLVSAHDTLDGESVEDGASRDGADCGIHAGGVASGGQDADTFDSSHTHISLKTKPVKVSDFFSIFQKSRRNRSKMTTRRTTAGGVGRVRVLSDGPGSLPGGVPCCVAFSAGPGASGIVGRAGGYSPMSRTETSGLPASCPARIETSLPSALIFNSPSFLSTVMSISFDGTAMWRVRRPSSITLSSS